MAEYNEKSIKILEGLEAVRKRPGMYIGSTDKRGLHHLVWEIVDNAIDEAINGYGNKITVKMTKIGSIVVEDHGRGVPTGKHQSGKSTPEVIYTVLHAGGKFENAGYKVSGGLHGVGSSVVNALSKWMKVTIKRDGKIHEITFKNGGHVDQPLKQIGTTRETGTTVEFFPDDEIFGNARFSYTTICERMQESAFLINGLTMEVIDEEDEKEEVYYYENGLEAFIDTLAEQGIGSPIHKTISINGEKNGIIVDVALQYNDGYNSNVISFVNNVKTVDGGSHVEGFKSALTKACNAYIKDNGLLKGKDTLSGEDTREGLNAIVSLKIPEEVLEFEGQTKSKLGTPIARTVVENIVYDKLTYFFQENPTTVSSIMDKALKSKTAREAARKAREEARNGKNSKKIEKNLSGKLAPAQGRNPKINELFLVEGDSAGGSAKGGRDRKFQAILPLRGKVLNTSKASIEEVYKNEELNTMIYTIGAGVGSSFEVEESNYDKVIIMTDADVDGAHIQILLLTFFYHYMRPLIEAGRLYIALPPLYKVEYGKQRLYAYTDEELQEIRDSHPTKPSGVQRYKGLGEMNADQLWETTMDPETRTLIRVTIQDAALAEKRVNVLMGDKVEPRKEWIDENVEFTLEDNYRG